MMLSHEQFHEHLPPEPGTAPIPEGHTRYYHQTGEENIPSIREHGLLFDKAKGIEGPKGIWASHAPFYGDARDSPTVEFHLPKDHGHIVALQHDVVPEQILAIHEPWHDKARYYEDNPDVKAEALAGGHDSLAEDYPEYDKAIKYIKGRSR
jgi:hypothetical protein